MRTSLEKEQLFSSAPVNKAIITLAVPTVISQLITVVYNMADTFFIGQMNDPNQVAAATLAMPVFILLTAFANLFGIGGASMISRCLGAGERDTARRCSAFCVWSALTVSLLYGIAVLCVLDVLLPLLGTDAATQAPCASYLFWTVGVGSAPTVLSACLAHLIRSEGYSAQASFGIAFGGILNIVLDPIFIFVLRLEIAGAAIATMLSNTAAVLFFLGFFLKMRRKLTITLSPRYFTLRSGIPAEVLSVGLPSFLISLMATFSNTVLNKIISGHSNEAVAGMGIAKKIDLLAFAVAQGMTQGTLPLIGYNYSSGNRPRMLRALRALLADCLVISICSTVFLFLAAAPVTRCIIDDAATVEYGRTFLRIICLTCPTTALNMLSLTIFQATGKKLQPLLLSMLRKGTLDIPLMLCFNARFGIQGVAWATPLSDLLALCVAAALVLPYLKRLSRS